MKILGVIGGIGPESTIEYYRLLIAEWRLHIADGSYPPVIINSIDLPRMIGLVGTNLPGLTSYLSEEVARLAAAGAGLAILAANTPHIVFDDVAAAATIPMISIVEATCRTAVDRRSRRLGLFGTRFTMRGRFYPDVFKRSGIEIVTPDDAEQDYIHDKYFSELVNGVFNDETRERLIAIAARMKKEEGIDALILGGTELPLILRDELEVGLPLLDTTAIHVEEAVEWMVG